MIATGGHTSGTAQLAATACSRSTPESRSKTVKAAGVRVDRGDPQVAVGPGQGSAVVPAQRGPRSPRSAPRRRRGAPCGLPGRSGGAASARRRGAPSGPRGRGPCAAGTPRRSRGRAARAARRTTARGRPGWSPGRRRPTRPRCTTTTSATVRSRPSARSAASSPSSQAMPVTPPPPRTSPVLTVPVFASASPSAMRTRLPAATGSRDPVAHGPRPVRHSVRCSTAA